MTLTIELTPEQEARLTAAARQESLSPERLAARLLAEHLPTLSAQGAGCYRADLSPEERIRRMDAFAKTNRGLPSLPDEAFDRKNLYGDNREPG